MASSKLISRIDIDTEAVKSWLEKADIVSVVRCRGCTWFDSPRVCLRHGRFVESSNWFCADGQRREDEAALQD